MISDYYMLMGRLRVLFMVLSFFCFYLGYEYGHGDNASAAIEV